MGCTRGIYLLCCVFLTFLTPALRAPTLLAAEPRLGAEGVGCQSISVKDCLDALGPSPTNL